MLATKIITHIVNLVEYMLTGRIGNESDRRSDQEESYHLGGEESEPRVNIKGECWNVISTLDQLSVPNE